MRATVLLSLLFLAGCGNPSSTKIPELREPLVFYKPTVEQKAEPVEQVALRYVGYAARTHRTELKEFIGVDPIKTEWCAAFVNAVLNESGMPGSESVSEYPLLARSFLDWGVAVKEPEPGDLVVFPRGSESWQGHVGFYLGTVTTNGIKYYAILGGNQNGKVSIELFRARSAISVRRFSA
jgi:uncharacterized protein (TIGR02594 family)